MIKDNSIDPFKPNSKRFKSVFHYSLRKMEDDQENLIEKEEKSNN